MYVGGLPTSVVNAHKCNACLKYYSECFIYGHENPLELQYAHHCVKAMLRPPKTTSFFLYIAEIPLICPAFINSVCDGINSHVYPQMCNNKISLDERGVHVPYAFCLLGKFEIALEC